MQGIWTQVSHTEGGNHTTTLSSPQFCLHGCSLFWDCREVTRLLKLLCSSTWIQKKINAKTQREKLMSSKNYHLKLLLLNVLLQTTESWGVLSFLHFGLFLCLLLPNFGLVFGKINDLMLYVMYSCSSGIVLRACSFFNVTTLGSKWVSSSCRWNKWANIQLTNCEGSMTGHRCEYPKKTWFCWEGTCKYPKKGLPKGELRYLFHSLLRFDSAQLAWHASFLPTLPL